MAIKWISIQCDNQINCGIVKDFVFNAKKKPKQKETKQKKKKQPKYCLLVCHSFVSLFCASVEHRQKQFDSVHFVRKWMVSLEWWVKITLMMNGLEEKKTTKNSCN